MNKFSFSWQKTILASGVLLAVLLFIVDLQTPLGIADGILYVSIVLLTLWLNDKRLVFGAGLIATILIITGYFLSPPNLFPGSLPFVNRAIALLATWVTVAFLHAFKRSENYAVLLRNRLETISGQIDEGVMITNMNRKIIHANAKINSLTGLTTRMLVGSDLAGLLLPGRYNENRNSWENVDISDPATFAGKEFLLDLRKKNGTHVPVSAYLSCIDTTNGKDLVFLVRDITERIRQREDIENANRQLARFAGELELANQTLEIRVEERTAKLNAAMTDLASLNLCYEEEILSKQEALDALKERELLLESVIANFPNGVLCLLDVEFNYVFAGGDIAGNNDAGGAGLYGKLYLPLKDEVQSVAITEKLHDAISGKKITFEHNDRETGRHYIVNGVPIYSRDHVIKNLLLVSQDITQIKQAELNVKEALLKEMELSEVKTRIVTTTSHEFRTPLGTILSSASLIGLYNRSYNDQKINKHVERISFSVAHLTGILDDCLSIVKLQNGLIPVRFAETALSDIVSEIADRTALYKLPDQRLIIDTRKAPDKILTDRKLINGILMNLLSNAIKFSADRSEIFLEIKELNGELFFKVRDAGIGIPDNECDNIFWNFYRARNAENVAGLGLGLHIVKKYVELLKGEIHVESKLGKGSSFTVKIPAFNGSATYNEMTGETIHTSPV